MTTKRTKLVPSGLQRECSEHGTMEHYYIGDDLMCPVCVVELVKAKSPGCSEQITAIVENLDRRIAALEATSEDSLEGILERLGSEE